MCTDPVLSSRQTAPNSVYELKVQRFCLYWLAFGWVCLVASVFFGGVSSSVLALSAVASILAGLAAFVGGYLGHDPFNGWVRLAFSGSYKLFAVASLFPLAMLG